MKTYIYSSFPRVGGASLLKAVSHLDRRVAFVFCSAHTAKAGKWLTIFRRGQVVCLWLPWGSQSLHHVRSNGVAV